MPEVLCSEEKGVAVSQNDIVWYLTDGFWEDRGGARHTFRVTPGDSLTVNITSLTPAGQQLARWALDAWSTVTGIQFQEVTHNDAHIMFDDADSQRAWSNYSYYFSDGATAQARVNVGTGWLDYYGTGITSYSFTTYVHEIGHALGLGHPGDYNAGDGPTPVTFSDATYPEMDLWTATVMSYFDQHENIHHTFLDWANPVSPMFLDIVAIHDLYGPPENVNEGDTIYGYGANTGTYMDEVFKEWEGGLFRLPPDIALTIYDTGGHDRLDFRTDSYNQIIDIGYFGSPVSLSGVYGNVGNLVLLSGTADGQGDVVVDPDKLIEEVVAGSGNDHLLGNAADNYLYGNSGNDFLAGGKGMDFLVGGPGSDTFFFIPQDGYNIDFVLDFDRRVDYIHLGEFESIDSLNDFNIFQMDVVDLDSTVIDLTLHAGGYVVLLDYTDPLREYDFIFGDTSFPDDLIMA